MRESVMASASVIGGMPTGSGRSGRVGGTRRVQRLKRLVSLALLLLATPLAAEPIKIDGGLVEGKDLGNGVSGWLGIPFASPPVRELRWRAPQPVKAWQGVYHADRFAPMCLQGLRARTMNHYFGNEATSEDCLYLNIWAPSSARAGAKLPVVVWIYGGAFNVGSASMGNYHGENLAREGVVYVSLAYRVGPFGFLSHPQLSAEQQGKSGNYGLMDQVAGLEWIQRNIAAFGGDPANVTIMGQSAGSMSVSILQINPRARGLFAKIVGMSGSIHGQLIAPVPLAKAEEQGTAIQQALGAESIEAMRNMQGDRILQGAGRLPRDPIVIDGANVPGPAAEVFASHRQNDVPILIGFTRDEGFANLGPARTVAEYETLVRSTFPATADAVLKAYPVTSDDQVQRALADIMRDMSVGGQMFDWAKANASYGTQPAYGYFFTRRHPYATGITFSDHDPATVGAYHTGEVPYFLRNLDAYNWFRKTRDWGATDFTLRDRMSGLILNFARTGKPGPDYPAFSVKSPKVLQLGDEVKVIDWPNAKTLPLLAKPVQVQRGLPPAPNGVRPRD